MDVTMEQLLQMIGAKQVAIELSLQPQLLQLGRELRDAQAAKCELQHCDCAPASQEAD